MSWADQHRGLSPGHARPLSTAAAPALGSCLLPARARLTALMDACPLPPAEGRCQAGHKKAMEAANEAKRLAPLEPQVARLQDALQASQAETDKVQREVTAHQASIRCRGGKGNERIP